MLPHQKNHNYMIYQCFTEPRRVPGEFGIATLARPSLYTGRDTINHLTRSHIMTRQRLSHAARTFTLVIALQAFGAVVLHQAIILA